MTVRGMLTHLGDLSPIYYWDYDAYGKQVGTGTGTSLDYSCKGNLRRQVVGGNSERHDKNRDLSSGIC